MESSYMIWKDFRGETESGPLELCNIAQRFDGFGLHKGQRALVLNTGPSAKLVDLPETDFTIGSYRSWEIKEPDYVSSVDYAGWKNTPDEYPIIAPKYRYGLIKNPPRAPKWKYVLALRFSMPKTPYSPIFTAFNSGFTNIMLAIAMGAKQVDIIGFDFTNVGKSWHSYNDGREDEHEAVLVRNFLGVAKCLNALLIMCKHLGIIVHNLSPISRFRPIFDKYGFDVASDARRAISIPKGPIRGYLG